jgi:curved DNA-binding protein CbpA
MMMQTKDYYGILGLTPEASHDEIKRAYRRLALRYHPDRNRDDPDSEDRLKEVNEAYRILGDVDKKRAYDLIYGRRLEGRPFMNRVYTDVDLEGVLRGMFVKDTGARGRVFCRGQGFGRRRCRRQRWGR